MQYIENNEKMQYKIPSASVIPRFTVDQINAFKPMLRFLNEKDRDILYLIFVTGKKQKDVQAITGRSQPSLCYDIKRIRKRLKFITYLLSVIDIFERFLVDNESFSNEDRDILTLVFFTSSFTVTSEIMGNSQVRVRYIFDKCIKSLERDKLWDIYEIFIIIRHNLNIVKRAYVRDDRKPLGDFFIP